jgi:xanthine phosphoribosyltransferase
VDENLYYVQVTSYTHGVDYTVTVPKLFISAQDSVLLIDDFLANGCALDGLIALTRVAGANLAGAGVVIEKGFQSGGKRIRESDIRLESLAIIESMGPEGIRFRETQLP